MAKITGKPYAIGGALAMSAHGYVRQTSRVDAFALLDDKLAWLRAARSVGLTVDEIFRDVHYIAFFTKHQDPRIRIDLLFPAAEPELSAIEFPATVSIGGVTAEAFPMDLLVMAKFQSDREGDARDFERMFHLGLFDPAQASVDGPLAKKFKARIAELSRPRLPAGRKPKRIPR